MPSDSASVSQTSVPDLQPRTPHLAHSGDAPPPADPASAQIREQLRREWMHLLARVIARKVLRSGTTDPPASSPDPQPAPAPRP